MTIDPSNYTFEVDAADEAEDAFLIRLVRFDRPKFPCVRVAMFVERWEELASEKRALMRTRAEGHARRGCVFCLASCAVMPDAAGSKKERRDLEFVLGEALSELRQAIRDGAIAGGGGLRLEEHSAESPPRPAVGRIAASSSREARWAPRAVEASLRAGGTLHITPYLKGPSRAVFRVVDDVLGMLDARWDELAPAVDDAMVRLDGARLGAGAGLVLQSTGFWALHVSEASDSDHADLVERLFEAVRLLSTGDPGAARAAAEGRFGVVQL